MALAKVGLTLAQYDTAFFLMCDRGDEQHINVQHRYITKSSSWRKKELLAEKHNYNYKKRKKKKASNYKKCAK